MARKSYKMRIIEPHTHMATRVTDDYEQMAICGIETVVEPAFWVCRRPFIRCYNKVLVVNKCRS